MAIARSSKRLNLRSEASARFERGCDPEGIDRAALRLCAAPRCHRRGRGSAAPTGRSTSGAPVPGPARVTGADGAGERRARQRPRRRPGGRVPRAHRVRGARPESAGVVDGDGAHVPPRHRARDRRRSKRWRGITATPSFPGDGPFAPQVGRSHPVPTGAAPGAPGGGRPRGARGVDAVAARPRRAATGGDRRRGAGGESAHPRRERAPPEPAARDAGRARVQRRSPPG